MTVSVSVRLPVHCCASLAVMVNVYGPSVVNLPERMFPVIVRSGGRMLNVYGGVPPVALSVAV